jgi:imidazolonepropionase-like amidohydrolase
MSRVAGARVIDLSKETVLPGLIDAHTHMFENPKPGMSRETSTLIAIQNTQLDLHAGFTAARDMSSHSNGYADVDVRDSINQGRIEGPRFQVSGRGIIWAGTAPAATAATPMTAQRVQSVEEAIAAVREHVEHGVDWIKLFPGGNYSFLPNGELNYVTTYPLPVLQALVDETHRLGHKTGCHVSRIGREKICIPMTAVKAAVGRYGPRPDDTDLNPNGSSPGLCRGGGKSLTYPEPPSS